MAFEHSKRIARSVDPIDYCAWLVMTLFACWLFRHHLLGDHVWIGNPDRLNGDLKYLKHYLFSLDGLKIAAWDEFEMMGWDSFSMVGLYPNPLIYILAAFGKNNMYITMGYIAIAMMTVSGIAAYSFLRTDFAAGIAPIVGAVCYELSTLTLLKVSQNSMSVAVFISIPLIALAIRRTNRNRLISSFLILAVLLSLMLNLMFLQKAAYALMLVGSYVVWRSYVNRSWTPLIVFGAALSVAFLFAGPRIVSVVEAVREYARIVEGVDLKNFKAHYKFQNIYPEQLLRWFDYGMFGRTMSEGVANGTALNLTEGVLFYTSAVVPFLLFIGWLRNRERWTNVLTASKGDTVFFFWALVTCFLVIIFKPVSYAIFVMFQHMDFMHARILIAGLLPLSYLVTLALTDLSTGSSPNKTSPSILISGLAAGLIASLLVDAIAESVTTIYGIGIVPPMRASSILHIGLSCTVFLILLFVLKRYKTHPTFHGFASFMISGVILSQCLIGANAQINGNHVFNASKPFNFGDFYYAAKEEFSLPSDEQLRLLHDRIEPESFRVALVCDQHIAGGFCAGHVPEFWQLRTIDGYYGLGVPRRLRALPWPAGASMRSISFLNVESMPWGLLGFLNVNAALIASDGVYRNVDRTGGVNTANPDPSSFQIVKSPARVTPRAFFAATAEPVASLEDAIKKIFSSSGIVDPEKISYIEGMDARREFSEGGTVSLKSSGDFLELKFDATSTERFLVLNELFYPGWRAEIDGKEQPILATNAVMRGVFVPPGATNLNLHYVTRSMTSDAWLMRISAILAALAIVFAMRRFGKK